MGFLTGKLIGKEGESDVCTTFLDKDYCGKENEKIAI